MSLPSSSISIGSGRAGFVSGFGSISPGRSLRGSSLSSFSPSFAWAWSLKNTIKYFVSMPWTKILIDKVNVRYKWLSFVQWLFSEPHKILWQGRGISLFQTWMTSCKAPITANSVMCQFSEKYNWLNLQWDMR